MKLILLIILLVPILIFQGFLISDSINIFMKTKKSTSRTNTLKTNNIYFYNERTPRKTNSRVIR